MKKSCSKEKKRKKEERIREKPNRKYFLFPYVHAFYAFLHHFSSYLFIYLFSFHFICVRFIESLLFHLTDFILWNLDTICGKYQWRRQWCMASWVNWPESQFEECVPRWHFSPLCAHFYRSTFFSHSHTRKTHLHLWVMCFAWKRHKQQQQQ